MVPPPAAVGPLGVDTSDAEDLDKTPRPHNQTIGHRSSKDSLDKTPRPFHQTIGHQPSIETLDKTPRPYNQTIGHRSSKEYIDKTPRLNNKTISHRSSTETLKVRRANSSSAAATHITISTATPSAANLSNHNNSHYYNQHRPSTSSVTSPTSPTTRSASKAPAIVEEPSEGISSKFSLSKKKKKRLQREEEEREEQRLKEEANEAIRRKHGEYHPPGHSQGLVHTHRIPHQHDHHHIEQSRSASRLSHKHHQGSVSSSRVVSPEPRSASRASTRSSASSFYTNSRNGSYIHHNGNGSGSGNGNGNGHKNGQGHSRPTSPMGEIVAMPADYFHTHPHMNVLEGLDAESMLSEHWDSNSDNEDESLSHYTNRGVRNDRDREEGRESEDLQRKASIDTSSSYRTNGSTSIVWQIPERPLSPSSAASSRHSRSRSQPHPQHQPTMNSISQQIHPDSNKTHHVSLEMEEIGGDGKPNHQSWPLNNMSTTGIVTGLSPEFDGRGEDIIRPHSSMSRYTAGREGGVSKYKDPRVERYLHHARSTSPDNSNIHSSTSNYRPHSRHSRHHRHDSNNTNIYPHLHDGSDHNNTATSSTAATAAELLRAKAGSRATNYRPYNLRSAKNGNTDAWSVHETVVSTDEHNYLAPLPPFQQGPAYTRVPKRKFCKFFCGGCRWWVLLLIILIPAGLIAVATAFLLHWFRVCIAIDPSTVEPIIYTIDPATVQGISLDYQTSTKGIINIVDSPSLTETKVIMKLRRQFYNMKDRQDLTGFKVSTLNNGFSRFVMDDEANKHREFFISSVLCSDSILTIEMPRPKPVSLSSSSANYTQEIGLDILLDQQDVLINLDQTLHRNATYKFRGVSNRNMVVQSLNINALSISYTSNAPASVVLQSVIVRDQLAVMSVSGDINATVGFGVPASGNSSSSGSGGGSTTPTTVNLNTLDGRIWLDISKGWNQSSTFQIDSPDIQLSKAGNIILPFGGSHNRTDVSVNGLKASEGQHSLTGTFKPQGEAPTPAPPRVTGTATTKSSLATPTETMTAPAATMPPGGSALGAGGSSVPAQLMIQANKNVAINFP